MSAELWVSNGSLEAVGQPLVLPAVTVHKAVSSPLAKTEGQSFLAKPMCTGGSSMLGSDTDCDSPVPTRLGREVMICAHDSFSHHEVVCIGSLPRVVDWLKPGAGITTLSSQVWGIRVVGQNATLTWHRGLPFCYP